jgi:excisionase family DNA binding protein
VPKTARDTRDTKALCSDGLLRPSEAAAFLGISRSVFWVLMQSGRIPFARVTPAGNRRIPRRALIDYAEARLVQADP